MPRHIVILTGPPGSGKTTTCCQLADLARRRGLDCAGLVCPARFHKSRKVGIDVLNLRTGELRPLAEADQLPAALRTPGYRFDAEAIAWGASVLVAACPCDLLIVDEIGPLELERGQGWVNALDVLRAGSFKFAVVVVRPHLVNTFEQAMGRQPLRRFMLPMPARDDLLDTILSPICSFSDMTDLPY
jgi:nucleoside-triphosphatase THEP1